MSQLAGARELVLAHAIDYAGLFPPAGLSVGSALANFRSYQGSGDAWALGRFVVGASHLDELSGLLAPDSGGLPLSVVCNVGEQDQIQRFLERAPGKVAVVGAVELKLAEGENFDSSLRRPAPSWKRYVEVPLSRAEELLPALRKSGALAKVRTGGTVPGAFPTPDALLSFLEQVVRLRLPFKATAGLHHVLRGSYPLTYESPSPVGTMYGYLNLVLATAVLWKGGGASRARDALLETEPASVRFAPGRLHWRDATFEGEWLAGLRQDLFHGFGSCSFREPLDELTLGWG